MLPPASRARWPKQSLLVFSCAFGWRCLAATRVFLFYDPGLAPQALCFRPLRGLGARNSSLLVFVSCAFGWRCLAGRAGQSDIAVDSLRADSGAACADARPELPTLFLIDLYAGQV